MMILRDVISESAVALKQNYHVQLLQGDIGNADDLRRALSGI